MYKTGEFQTTNFVTVALGQWITISLQCFSFISFTTTGKEKPDIIDIIERKRLQWYGHVKRMQEERIPKLIMEWILKERRKRGRPRKTWMEGVRAAMKTRHL
jgi:hypothetical protein